MCARLEGYSAFPGPLGKWEMPQSRDTPKTMPELKVKVELWKRVKRQSAYNVAQSSVGRPGILGRVGPCLGSAEERTILRESHQITRDIVGDRYGG